MSSWISIRPSIAISRRPLATPSSYPRLAPSLPVFDEVDLNYDMMGRNCVYGTRLVAATWDPIYGGRRGADGAKSLSISLFTHDT